MNRKIFFKTALLGTGSLILSPSFLISQTTAPVKDPRPDPLPADKVKEFVGAAHKNLDVVKKLHEAFPNLLYASQDWGGGDFESGIEAAGHVGNKEIADYLIKAGARTNLFVLAMLGKTAYVKAYLELYPDFLNARGPHGYTLLHHAQKGGADGLELLEYLKSKGATEPRFKLYT